MSVEQEEKKPARSKQNKRNLLFIFVNYMIFQSDNGILKPVDKYPKKMLFNCCAAFSFFVILQFKISKILHP